ncbi:MAG: hypothetical protein AAF716_09115 [Cyanobacteria bacterium P01_D01_bin.1]
MPVPRQSLTALSVAPSKAANEHVEGNQPASDSDRVCWAELKRYPYHPDHQVELLHLQAEADALIIKLRAANREIPHQEG